MGEELQGYDFDQLTLDTYFVQACLPAGLALYGHVKLSVVMATIYIYAHDAFMRFLREVKKLHEI